MLLFLIVTCLAIHFTSAETTQQCQVYTWKEGVVREKFLKVTTNGGCSSEMYYRTNTCELYAVFTTIGRDFEFYPIGGCSSEFGGVRCICSAEDTYCAFDVTNFEQDLKEKIANTPADTHSYYQCFLDDLSPREADAICETSYDNQNLGMTNELRNKILSKHNSLRITVAIGSAINGKTGTHVATASYMRPLTWSCELEKTAHIQARRCTRLDAAPEGISENRHVYTNRTSRPKVNAAISAIQLWWSELSKLESGIDQTQNLYLAKDNIDSFAKIASDLTTKVGCGVVNCGNVLNVICHYETTLKHGYRLYEMGTPCSLCPAGTATCVNGLCGS